MVKGSTVDLRYEVTDLFPVIPFVNVSICIVVRWKDRELAAEGGFRKHDGERLIKLSAVKRGEYKSDGAFFRFEDPAGFFRYDCTPAASAELTVYPTEEDGDFLIRRLRTGGDSKSRNRKKTRNDLFIESRKYLPGDDVRMINWKAYAHLGELLVRIGEEVPQPESQICIAADLSCGLPDGLDYSDLDDYLEAYVSLLIKIARFLKNRNIHFVFAGGKSPEKLLSGLWWNDYPAPGNRETGSLLLVSTAFSTKAEYISRQAAAAGLDVNIFIAGGTIPAGDSPEGESPAADGNRPAGSPVPASLGGKDRPALSDLLKICLFPQNVSGAAARALNSRIEKRADELMNELRKLPGVINVEII